MPTNPSAPPHRRLTGRPAALLTALGLLGFGLGCQSDQVAHYRVPKEGMGARPALPGAPPRPMGQQTGANAELPPGSGPQAGTKADLPPGQGPQAAASPELPPPPTPRGKDALKWSLPKGWSQLPGDGMRFATLKPPTSGKVEATVSVFPGAAGGELPNVNRWRGQIGLPAMDEAAQAKARVVLKTKAGQVNVYDFTSEGGARTRVVVGFIHTPDDKTWFLKLTGDADPVAKARPDFMHILESLRLD